MAYGKFKKGGQGGKLGHSNMAHWEETEIVKKEFKKKDRKKARKKLKKFIKEGGEL